jgi:hypothetical protein
MLLISVIPVAIGIAMATRDGAMIRDFQAPAPEARR